jgi:hypothetical protein
MDKPVTYKTKTVMRCPECGQEVKSQVVVTEAWCQKQDAHSSRRVEMVIDVLENA